MMKQLTAKDGDHQSTLLDFLAVNLDISKKAAKRLLDARSVFVNHKRVWMAKHTVKKGDVVEVQRAGSGGSLSKKAVRYEDVHYLIIDKPAGLLSVGADSAESRIKELLQLPEVQAVHRLDADTTGCLMLAKSEPARRAIVSLFDRRAITKIYRAIVVGRLQEDMSHINVPVDGQSASTRIRVLDRSEKASHLQAMIETGRTHQIRKHLAEAGFPVVGDKQYATGRWDDPAFRKVQRQMLHASEIRFWHPIDKRPVRCRIQPPRDFSSCLKSLHLS